jgi:hypothetical protein
MRFIVSHRGAKYDLGTGLTMVGWVGLMLLPLFLVLDALAGRLTYLYPALLVACVLVVALGGLLASGPLTAAAHVLLGLCLGAVVLICFSAVSLDQLDARPGKVVALRVIGVAGVAGVLSLLAALALKRLAVSRGEAV